MTASILNMAASIYLILEGVMLAQWLRESDERRTEDSAERGREEGREEGKELGHRAERRAWRSWYERMQSARQAGLAFNEPPTGQSEDAVDG